MLPASPLMARAGRSPMGSARSGVRGARILLGEPASWRKGPNKHVHRVVGVARHQVGGFEVEGDEAPVRRDRRDAAELVALDAARPTLTRRVVPVWRSRTKTSGVPLVSPGTRLVASEVKATKRPSAEIAGDVSCRFALAAVRSHAHSVVCARLAVVDEDVVNVVGVARH